MSAATHCPHCGAGLSEDVAAHAACPVCLFKLALDPASGAGEPSAEAWCRAAAETSRQELSCIDWRSQSSWLW